MRIPRTRRSASRNATNVNGAKRTKAQLPHDIGDSGLNMNGPGRSAAAGLVNSRLPKRPG